MAATQEDRQDLRHLDKPEALLPPQNSGRPFLPSPTGSRTRIQVRVSRRALSPCRVCPPRKSGRDVVGPSVSSASLLCLWCLPTHHHCVLDPTVLPASGLGPHASVGSTDASAVNLPDSSPMCISLDFTNLCLFPVQPQHPGILSPSLDGVTCAIATSGPAAPGDLTPREPDSCLAPERGGLDPGEACGSGCGLDVLTSSSHQTCRPASGTRSPRRQRPGTFW